MGKDISFLISGMMNLYEHQSTFNPNMPIRGLMYLCKLYEKYIIKNKIDIYTSTPKTLPFPQYFVFYNGTKSEPDRQDLLEKCQRLKEYAIFVDTVRQELSSDRPLELAVSSAIDICIRKKHSAGYPD